MLQMDLLNPKLSERRTTMPYVYSTLANDVNYTKWHPIDNNDQLRIDRQVLIKGGANVADKRLITPLGVVTEVTEEDLKLLLENQVFKQHKEAGHVTVERNRHEVEVIVADMKSRETSSPLVPQDYADGKQPKTGAPEEE